MHKKLCIMVFGLFLAMPLLAFEHHDEDVIKQNLNKGFEAVAKQDWATLGSLCTSDWSLIDHMGTRMDMAGVKGLFTAQITEHTTVISNIEVHLSRDASMAWATLDEKANYKFGGTPMSESAAFTAILVKEGDIWKIRALQRTVIQPPPAMTEK